MVKVTCPHNIIFLLILTYFLSPITCCLKCNHTPFILFCEGKDGNRRSSKDEDEKSNKDDDDDDDSVRDSKHADTNDEDRYNRRVHK